MMLVFLLFLNGPITLPHPSAPSQTYWMDLNQDGLTDIWTQTKDGQVWVFDAAESQKGFQLCAQADRIPRGLPVPTDSGWAYVSFVDGALLKSNSTGWDAFALPSELHLRYGDRAQATALGWLIPTETGMSLYQNDCFQTLPVSPSLTIQKRALVLRYPELEVRDLDGDGDLDLFAAPLLLQESGEVRFFMAFNDNGSWRQKQGRSHMPLGYKIETCQVGDFNGDDQLDIVALLMPNKDMSVFDELSFTYFLGEKEGWSAQAPQVLETQQNLWQTGPIVISPGKIELFYFKGLIHAKFRHDTYLWDEEYFTPKPKEEGWTVDDGDRDLMIVDLDLNHDGQPDLLLSGKKGLVFYPRKTGKQAFSEKDGVLISERVGGSDVFNISIGSNGTDTHWDSSNIDRNQLHGRSGIAFVQNGEHNELWHWVDQFDSWQLQVNTLRPLQ
ncbi:MAG: VCBS repeat-containing protein [Acidobacteria bacterium]|nr:VCBS repeat-containing protein [Acidobacteriota bacterium]MCB9399145.1 VCBS repeat-containing protein [Acidobacteriota bacterium]